MRLYEHAEFEQAILEAENYFDKASLSAAIIEKDYYITEALRNIASESKGRVIFKGGTSLSKGWNLIERFSEDIDIFFDPESFTPTLGKNAINRELKKLRNTVNKHPALTYLTNESRTIGGFGRHDTFSFEQRIGNYEGITNTILLEVGTASGKQPTETIKLQSYLSQFLNEANYNLGCDDQRSFPMTLLHFRRTFVEKMFAIHSKVETYKTQNIPIGKYARHYYDLFQLSQQSETIKMLESDEYQAIKDDYDRISRTHFGRDYLTPNQMKFCNSDALFPTSDLKKVLGDEYTQQCGLLCYGDYPAWDDVIIRFEKIKSLL